MTEEQERASSFTGVERLGAVAGPHVRQALSDDTIELALTEDDMLALSRAAEEEHAETSLDRSAVIATGALLRDQSVRSRRWRPLLASSILAIVIGSFIGIVSSVVAVDRSSPALWVATRSAKSLDSPVRFSNPFDASEVFEFPHGTSDDHARRSVAAILLRRARNRQEVDVANGNQEPPAAAIDRARIARDSEATPELSTTQ